MEFKITNKKTCLSILIFAILLYWGLNHMELIIQIFTRTLGILTPFLLGGALAFILNVPMKLIERLLGRFIKGKDQLLRVASMLISYILAIGLLAFVIMTVIPELINTIQELNKGIPAFLDDLDTWVKGLGNAYPEIKDYIASIELNWPKIYDTILNFLQSGVTNVLTSTWGVATSVIGVVATTFLGIVFSAYILAQKEKLGLQAQKVLNAYLPEKRAATMVKVGSLSHKTFSGFIAGQFTEALIFGLLCYVGMLICRFPYAVSISVLVGFTTLIPVLGAFLGTGLGAILILVTNPMQAVWFIVMIIVLQQIDENLIYPRVVGNSVGLPGMWVMLAVTLGGSLMGVLGMLIFVPLVSVCYALFREDVYKRLRMKGIKQGNIKSKKNL